MNVSGCKRKLLTVLAVFVMGVAGTLAHADDSTEETEPLALRKIMKELGKNMQAITDGISREDWEKVAEIAPQVADHLQPPFFEKVRILAYVGSDVGAYKDYDGETHEAAEALAEAADMKDGASVIAAFARLQTSCMGCHQDFRQAFVEHFYEQD